MISKIIVSTFIIMAFIIAVIALDVFSKFTYREMDWNNDKNVSLKELLNSIDIDKRKVKNDSCIEYYYLKDGMPFKLVCVEN